MLINEKLIDVNVEVDTWQESAKVVGNLLLREKLIDEKYIDSMINSVEKFGPYMILAPKVCFFHGEPGDMVNEPCLSLITLKNEVYFSEFDNEPIKSAFAFGARDSESHLDMIKKIAELLADNEFIKLITNNGTKEDILKRIEG